MISLAASYRFQSDEIASVFELLTDNFWIPTELLVKNRLVPSDVTRKHLPSEICQLSERRALLAFGHAPHFSAVRGTLRSHCVLVQNSI
jgi:hypothetical protein